MKKDLAVKGLIALFLVIATVNFIIKVVGGSFHRFIELLEFMGILSFIMIGILFVIDLLSKNNKKINLKETTKEIVIAYRRKVA